MAVKSRNAGGLWFQGEKRSKKERNVSIPPRGRGKEGPNSSVSFKTAVKQRKKNVRSRMRESNGLFLRKKVINKCLLLNH